MRIAVCDDNSVMLDTLTDIVEREFTRGGGEYGLTKFRSGGDLLKSHSAAPFDVLFLDICMPDVDGFEVAKAVRKTSDKVFIIFITNKEELIYDSFDFRPFNFVKKESGSLTERRIAAIIKKLLRHRKQYDDLTLEPAFAEKRVVSVKDIIYISSDKNYLEYILTDAKNCKVRGTLREAEERFLKCDFVKIHKSFLVNMRHIEKISYTDCKITLTNGNVVYMGKTYKKSIDESYTSYQRSLR